MKTKLKNLSILIVTLAVIVAVVLALPVKALITIVIFLQTITLLILAGTFVHFNKTGNNSNEQEI